MESLHAYVKKQIFLSALSCLLVIPYTYLLFQMAYSFLAYHGWPGFYLLLPAISVSLVFLYFFPKKLGSKAAARVIENNGYYEVNKTDDIPLRGPYGNGETAYSKLRRLFNFISEKLHIQTPTFYVYPRRRENHQNINIFLLKDGDRYKLLFPLNYLEDLPDGVLLAVLCHEAGHILTSKFSFSVKLVSYLTELPARAAIIFIAFAIGFFNWWLFIPSLLLLCIVHQWIVGFPIKICENLSDAISVKMGFGEGMISFLGDLPLPYRFACRGYDSVNTRIKRVKKHMTKF